MITEVWVVTYFNPAKEVEPTVTVFNNADAAQQYYEHCKNRGDEYVCVDTCPIYSQFIMGEREGMLAT